MEIFAKNLIYLKQDIVSKGHCISQMIDYLFDNNLIDSKEDFTKAVFDREEIMSTGIGRGIAIPHGRSKCVKKLSCVFMTLKKDIDFDSIDGDPVKIVFMLAIPDNANNEYMKILGQISKNMRENEQRDALIAVSTFEEAYQILKGIEDDF
ncbi:MAG TPA: PTS sugar transporter subunit IIA [Candidatus Cloacimonadota bacterium]|nr:PTS sugar transporter subunit IIA [Candidatus Cloacimonadota bacterium]